MSNIDNIIEKLKVEANEKIDIINREAEEKSREVKEEILLAARTQRDKILKDSQDKADSIYSRISENAEIRIRDQRLSERQKLIDRVFDLALKKLNSRPDDEFILEVKKALEGVNAENMTLRVPKSRLEAVKKQNLGIKIDEENFVENGFILSSEKMNYNFNYKDILNDNRDQLGPQLIEFLSKWLESIDG